jgi:hypothetical protein
MDTVAPELAEIADMTVSTDIWGCGATIDLPEVSATDNCSSSESISYTYTSSAGVQVGNTFVLSDPAKTMPGEPVVITVTATDCCGNNSSTDFEVSVVDLVPPVVIGETTHTVSLTTTGTAKVFAEDFDDGSHDGCGPIGFFVKRMDNGSPCPTYDEFPPAGNDNAQYNEAVFFCCADAGDEPVMVQFQVCDDANMDGIIGNGGDNCNFAMVEVYVQDKLAPQILCPAPMTISCIDLAGLDLTDEALLNEIFGNAEAAGTCDVSISQTVVGNEVCGAGVIFRNFTATNAAGTSSCQQIITVEAGPANSLTCEKITFADLNNNTYNWCAVNDGTNDNDDDLPAIEIDCTDGLSIPEVVIDYNGLCTEAGISIEVDTFNFAGGACRKYVIHYEVIDQCIFDENYVDPNTGEVDPFNSGNGYFEMYIEVDAFDTEAPTATCDDVTYVAETCEGADPTIIPSATDNCTDPAYFGYQWRLDLDNNNTIDYPVSGWHASSNVTAGQAGLSLFPIGTHRIFWIISDGCGNDATCSQLVTITGNDKQPTPYCYDGLSVAVMPTTGTVSLWANDFDAGSFDNCDGELIFSMIPESDVAGMDAATSYAQSFDHANVTQQSNGDWGFMFTCDYIPNGVTALLEIRVYVTDADGNYDYCTASLRLDDNFDACEDDGSGMLTISGDISTEEGKKIELVDIELDSDYPEFPKSEVTVEDGNYSFTNLFENVDYKLTPSRNDYHLNGITTLDIVMIQKHILGLDVIVSPYKLIAADVNNDCQVTGADLVQLRKLILGKYTNDELPDNSSWRFVTDEFTFTEGVQPCQYDELVDMSNMSESHIEDFYGIKVGDINGSVEANFTDEADTRTNGALEFEVEEQELKAGKTYEVRIQAKDFQDIYGFQYSIELNGAEYVSIESGALPMKSSNVGTSSTKEMLWISYAEGRGMQVTDEETLFTITLKSTKDGKLSKMMSIVSSPVKGEAYVGTSLEIAQPKLTFRTERGTVIDATFALGQNEPNPFKEQTTITFELPKTAEATISVYDVSGKVLYVKTDEYSKGENVLTISRKEIKASGVLYYKLESGDHVSTRKMIVIE